MPFESGQTNKARMLVAEKAFRWWASVEMHSESDQSEQARLELMKAVQAAIGIGCWQAEVKNLNKGFALPDI